MFIGLGLSLTRRGRAGAGAAFINLSNNNVNENVANGTVVGTLSVIGGSGVYTFTETADPGNKFAIVGNDIQVNGALDYETATSHLYTVQANNGVDPAITRQFTILVNDLSEGGSVGQLDFSQPEQSGHIPSTVGGG